MLGDAGSSTFFSCVIDLDFERNTFCYVGFPGKILALIVRNRPVQLSDETHIYIERNPCVLLTIAFSTLFHCKYLGTFQSSTSCIS
jgi:hypothetical protein